MPIDPFYQQKDFCKNLILRSDKAIRVKKKSRAGFTYSTLQGCSDLKKTVTAIEPTIKILQDTVLSARSDAVIIESNETWCLKPTKDLLFPYHVKGKCKTCKHNPDAKKFIGTACNRKKALIALNTSTCIGITYKKLHALYLKTRTYPDAEDLFILEQILSSNVILLDEFSNALELNELTPIYYWDFFKLCKIIEVLAKKNMYKPKPRTIKIGKRKGKVVKTVEMLNLHIAAGFLKFQIMAAFNLDPQNPVAGKLHGKLKVKLTPKEARSLLKNKKFIPIKLLNAYENLLKVLCNDYFTWNNGVLSTDNDHLLFDIDNMLQSYKGKLLITGLALPHTSIFNGIEIKMPDFNKTESQQLIVCDKTHYNLKKGWYEEEDKILNIINNLSDVVDSPDNILVVTMNKYHAKLVRDAIDNKQIRVLAYEHCTHFRSDKLAGIELNPRPHIIICLGLCHTPMASMDAYDTLHHDLYDGHYDSQELRILEMQQVFINTIGRCKDPKGQERSIVFVLGDRIDKVKELSDKEEIIEIQTQNTMPEVASIIYDLWTKGTCIGREDIPTVAQVKHKMKETGKDAKSILTYMRKNNQLTMSAGYYLDKYFA